MNERVGRRPALARGVHPISNEVAVAVAVVAALVVAVLLRAPQLLEPDDFAYRASIVALSQGHVLLTNAQYLALNAHLSVHGGGGIEQWTHLASGRWISQKNPGYPFFAVAFQWLHALRLAPLFYGALACAGLFFGGRRWLGPWGGTYAVALYCSSGASLVFAWRSTMPTFTDASLIAGGAGLLLGVLLSPEMTTSRRRALGSLAFLALDGAVVIRYSDVTVVVVALVAVPALSRACRISRRTLVTWFAAAAVPLVAGVVLDRVLYGSFTKTGYPSGLITFSTRAIAPNIERMPGRLVESMPLVLVALAAVVGILVRLVRGRATTNGATTSPRAQSDATVALVLVAGWLSVWALYSSYTWTVAQTLGPGNPVHVVRFYVPSLGLISLIGAWFFQQLPRWTRPVLLVALASLGLWYFVTPTNDGIVHPPSYHGAAPVRSGPTRVVGPYGAPPGPGGGSAPAP